MQGPETRSSRYDVVVVGAGPAGISAAINVANRKRTVVVMDGQPPFAKTRKAHSIPNYPGFTYASGEELAAAFVAHLEEFGVAHLREKVSRISPDDDGFLVFTDRDAYHAGAIVLATGVYREAELEGEEELVGQGVSYCVTCDGRLFAGREVAFVSYGADGEEEASILADDFGTTVTYLPLYAGEYDLPEGVRVLPRVRPERLSREDGKVHVHLPEEELAVDAVFIHKHSVSPAALLDGLASDGRHLIVDRRLETGIQGVFAAGDSTGEPYQIAKAVGEGQVAALHAIEFLRERAHPAAASEPPALKLEDREELTRILRDRMRDPVRLLHFTQSGGAESFVTPCAECREALRLLTELTELSPKLSLDVHDFMGAMSMAKDLGVARVPATLVGAAGDEHPRVRFYGTPSGYEFGALLDDILQVSQGREELSPQTLEALAGLSRPVHLEVLTTPTCPYCPGAVRIAHRFALASPMVVADMVAAAEFPELAQRYHAASVPLLVVDGRPDYEGGVTEQRVLDLVLAAGAAG